jgi:hypothetical protein
LFSGSIIDSFKSFFGVKKEVNEIKISVTQEKFLKKSWKVGKKKLHQRKIVPVIIWDNIIRIKKTNFYLFVF